MRRVPNTNQFVAVEVESEPANLFLYQMGTSGEVSYLGPASFEISDPNAVYGFSGNPATQVIVDDGTMLEIDTDTSKCSQDSFTAGCFTQIGALGTLSGAQRFIGLDNDLNGKLYGLVDTSPSYDGFCASGCLVEQIDVASRTVSSQATYQLASAGSIVNVRHDPTAKALVVGYSTANDFSPSETKAGYVVVSLSYWRAAPMPSSWTLSIQGCPRFIGMSAKSSTVINLRTPPEQRELTSTVLLAYKPRAALISCSKLRARRRNKCCSTKSCSQPAQTVQSVRRADGTPTRQPGPPTPIGEATPWEK